MDIELQPFTRADFSRLIAWSGSAEFLTQWSGSVFNFPLDAAQLENYMKVAEAAEPTRKIFRVVEKSSGAVIGHIELDLINRRNCSASVVRVLIGEPAMRGKGIGEQMMRRILEIGFDQLGLHRIALGVFDFNTSALACYEQVGFKKEGLMRESTRVGDRYWNVCTMAILESEWRSLTP